MVFKNKRGIGIIEVMVAALVLGILYAAVSNLQKGNRDTLLRIRGRDGATEVAQNVIDNLSAMGLATFAENNTAVMRKDDETGIIYVSNYPTQFFPTSEWTPGTDDTIQTSRTWHGQPGIGGGHDMEVKYDVVVTVSPDDDYKAQAGSLLLLQDASKKCGDEDTECVSHVYARRLDVSVSWLFKNSRQSISVSGVIR
ncbi:type II secretion system protein [Fibrobacter sp.]|uniref:type IV pilus modification PilV family protein n=1 Tax=Fibrobacter sp. TaxID=35828 RepID=UPI00389006A7